jgi:CheY-like chemotaxis protein
MKKPSTQAPKYKKVLLIDDNDIDNFINERIMTSSNFAETVVVKNSGPLGLAYLRMHMGKDEWPDIIFLDLNMPLMDGFSFLEELEKMISDNNELSDYCKVVVLSSSISPADINKASTNPLVYKYLNKPMSEKYLEAIDI